MGLSVHLVFKGIDIPPIDHWVQAEQNCQLYKIVRIRVKRRCQKEKAIITCEVFAVEFSTLRTAASDRSVVYHRLGTGRSLLLSEFTGVLEGFYELIHKAPATGYSPAMQLCYFT